MSELVNNEHYLTWLRSHVEVFNEACKIALESINAEATSTRTIDDIKRMYNEAIIACGKHLEVSNSYKQYTGVVVLYVERKDRHCTFKFGKDYSVYGLDVWLLEFTALNMFPKEIQTFVRDQIKYLT